MTFTVTQTGVETQAILNNADNSNVGKGSYPLLTLDANDLTESGRSEFLTGGSANLPENANTLIQNLASGDVVGARGFQIASNGSGKTFWRNRVTTTPWSAWQEFYHTGNTGSVTFASQTPDGSANRINLGVSGASGTLVTEQSATTSRVHCQYFNPNGQVGSISTSGNATSFNTSSDPRLKDFKGKPSDEQVNTEFEKLFDCFDTFNWKTDPEGQLVWGFNAHTIIDNGLDIGTEGTGPRDMEIGEVYETIEAETDEDGNIIKEEQQLRVTPAGVDQSKAVPILAKIEQLERRVAEMENK